MNKEDYRTMSFPMFQVENPKDDDVVYTHDGAIFFDKETEKYNVNCFTCGWKWVGKTFDQDAAKQHQQYYTDIRLKGEKKDDE